MKTLLKTYSYVVLCLVMGIAPQGATAQTVAPPSEEGLLVVYGAFAHTREGDIDHRETVFFSVPAGLKDRLYVRLFDPEMSGQHDFVYGRRSHSETVFRLSGGEGAFSGIARPQKVADGARPNQPKRGDLLKASPGKVLREATFTTDLKTNGQWVTLGSLRARQGEVIDGRAYFRLDVLGTDGDDGNGFSLDVSLSRDRHRPPEGLEMFAYQPTIRWPGGAMATRVEFLHDGGPVEVQNFDGAAGDLRLNLMYRDARLRASGQNTWAVSEVETDEALLALTLKGGFETPNDVTLSVFDEEGAALPLIMPPRKAPDPERPSALPRARPLADCTSVAFDGSLADAHPLLAYEWDFGDGQTSDEPVIVYSYGAPGRYQARLRVLSPGTAAARGNEAVVPVHVRPAPKAVAGDEITVAPGEPVGFDASASVASDSPITRYLWTYGDGTVGQDPVARKVYEKAGRYQAVLRVSDNSNHPCNFGLATRVVNVNFAPVAEAGTDVSTIVGQPVRLNGGASYDVDGSIVAHVWDLGDGTQMEGAEVSHAFDAAGVYRVALSVTDDSGVSNRTSTDHVTVRVNAPPEPKISGPSEALAVGEAFVLDGRGSVDADGTILSYLWDFGDGAMAEGESAEYAWAIPGVYDVTLTVIDDSGTASAMQSTVAQVIVNTRPVAEAGVDQFVTASEVQFDGSGSSDIDGQITSYSWDFGDGAVGRGVRPTHAYARPGRYEVALTVQDDSGAPQSHARDTMWVVVNASPIADAGPSLTVAPGEGFVLDAGASVDPDGAIAAYRWTLPDGTTKDGERVSVREETPGLYRYGLSVMDDFRGGGATDDSEVLMVVNAAPVAVAGPDILVAPDEEILFDARGSYDPDGRIAVYSWEFDDLQVPLEGAQIERAYPAPGVWSAQLVVRDDSGVSNGTDVDTVTIRVNHAPIAEAGPVINTDRLMVTLDAGGSSDADGDALIYSWDFGDGSAMRYGQQVSHVFAKAGSYPVTLWVDDGTGLSNARDVDATTVTINAPPVAMAGGNRDVCSGDAILFDASASSDADGDLLQYLWEFGDGSQSEIVNPTKTYEQPGTYPVTLTVQDESGSALGRDQDRVAVIVREGPIANAGPDMSVCVNQEIRLDGTASSDADGSVNSYEWTFGDGTRGSGARPVHTFERVGLHTVTLTIVGDAQGACNPIDTDTVNISVRPAKSQSIAAPERVASGLEVAFRAVLGDEPGTGEAISHSWDFGDGATAEGMEPRHSFAEPGVYTVVLTSEMQGGQQDCGQLVSRHRIVVNGAPVAMADAPREVSVGETVIFDGGGSHDPDGVITGFAWDFGDGVVSEGVLGVHRYTEPGTYTVLLEVQDDAGVENSYSVAIGRIKVNPDPVAGLQTPAPLCPGVPFEWQADVAEGTEVTWTLGDAKREGVRVSHAFERPGVYPVRADMDDGKGLSNSKRLEEIYVRVNASPEAYAGPDRVVCPGDEVTFSAKGSDIDGDVTGWQWVFSDGVVLDGPKVTRRFDEVGPADVRLVIQDDSGSACAIGEDHARILVNAPPVVDAGADIEAFVGAAHDVVVFDATSARDPDGQGVRLEWAFGDGTDATGAVARHRYAQPGDYEAIVTARDSTGLTCGVATDRVQVRARARGQ
ncbi:PKD domain-containing protein [Shimia sp. CNT1-13L.2]|uniref:PKD domain-containing protein n=1 Tax=Shimia sp. CNT1-13L.2 TaxID=2959663 RepID=UPI0020CE7562|nr:PKD domain-containing protein [Shimia sp. CNT1-13L.2]MCP9481346.1 PKD domain-containing protein [Shimia sp. CNT1-13L.2]